MDELPAHTSLDGVRGPSFQGLFYGFDFHMFIDREQIVKRSEEMGLAWCGGVNMQTCGDELFAHRFGLQASVSSQLSSNRKKENMSFIACRFLLNCSIP